MKLNKTSLLGLTLTAIFSVLTIFFTANNQTTAAIYSLLGGVLTVVIILFWRHIFLGTIIIINMLIIFIVNYIYYINQNVETIMTSGIFLITSLALSLLMLVGVTIVGGKYLNVNIIKVLSYQTVFNIFITSTVLLFNNIYMVLLIPFLQTIMLAISVIFFVAKQNKKANIVTPNILSPINMNDFKNINITKTNLYFATTIINHEVFHICTLRSGLKISSTSGSFTVDGKPANNDLQIIVEYVNSMLSRNLKYEPLNIILTQRTHKNGDIYLKIKPNKSLLKTPNNVFVTKNYDSIVPFLK